ncbi:MAG TPA: hypothetical protein V6C78_28130 [Crinalium sp.]|jgi:hypothetical protein
MGGKSTDILTDVKKRIADEQPNGQTPPSEATKAEVTKSGAIKSEMTRSKAAKPEAPKSKSWTIEDSEELYRIT